jgi:hypothetical protein
VIRRAVAGLGGRFAERRPPPPLRLRNTGPPCRYGPALPQSWARSIDRHGSGTGVCLARPSHYRVCPAGFALRTRGAASAVMATDRRPSQGFAARGNPHPFSIAGHGKFASKQGSRRNHGDASCATPRWRYRCPAVGRPAPGCYPRSLLSRC